MTCSRKRPGTSRTPPFLENLETSGSRDIVTPRSARCAICRSATAFGSRLPGASSITASSARVIVNPGDVQVLDPTDTPTLTLVTCYPFTFVGRAPQRFIVQATREDDLRPPDRSE